MSLNESIVEDAALTWFGELGYAVGHGPQMAPGEPAAERELFGEVVQFRFASTLIPAFSQREKEEDREAIRRLNPAIPEEARAVVKRYLNTRFERRPSP
jgi:type I restriction enzyme R subunit